MKLFLAPHNDDETLFGAFTILREQPLVVIATDSHRQYNRGLGITAEQRKRETLAALSHLGQPKCQFLGFRDNDFPMLNLLLKKRLEEYGQPEMVYAPATEEEGHEHHNLVSSCARLIFQNVTYYMTYTTAGKSRGVPVPFEKHWPLLKLKALACYESQILEPSTRDHFLREQYEYYYA